jgi:non-ribosomal peptide synthetase component F
MTDRTRNRLEGALPRLTDYMKRAAERDPGHPAFIYKDEELSYGEFSKNAHQFARFLLKIGVQKGDRLGYIMNGLPPDRRIGKTGSNRCHCSLPAASSRDIPRSRGGTPARPHETRGKGSDCGRFSPGRD